MNDRPPPQLDMTLEGEFVSPPAAPIASRLLLWALVIAVLAGAVVIAALALWLAFAILPVAVGAAVVAWGIYRYQLWRAHRSIGGQRSVWRRDA